MVQRHSIILRRKAEENLYGERAVTGWNVPVRTICNFDARIM